VIQIVDRASAVLGLANEHPVGVDGANHVSMCKFSDAKSQKYLQVSRPIRTLVDSITSNPVPCTSVQCFPMMHRVVSKSETTSKTLMCITCWESSVLRI
jgi:hypothetical protein